MLLLPYRMRAAHGVLLHLFAVVLAPYFVHFCDSWKWSRDRCGAHLRQQLAQTGSALTLSF